MQGSGRDADQGTDKGQHQGKQDRHPGTEDHPGQNVPCLVVGAQPIDAGGRAGGGLVQVVVGCVVTERNRWKQQPAAILLDQFLHVVAAVVGLERQLPAEGLFGVALEDREIPLALIADHQRFVVGDQFAAQGHQEQADKQPERPPAPTVFLEPLEAATRQR
ncbi:hypothetical protein D3C71_756720 [compost metagenome]